MSAVCFLSSSVLYFLTLYSSPTCAGTDAVFRESAEFQRHVVYFSPPEETASVEVRSLFAALWLNFVLFVGCDSEMIGD